MTRTLKSFSSAPHLQIRKQSQRAVLTRRPHGLDCSPPGSAHGLPQARILPWVAFPSSGDLPDLGIKPQVSSTANRFLNCLSHQGNPFKVPHLFFFFFFFNWLQDVACES